MVHFPASYVSLLEYMRFTVKSKFGSGTWTSLTHRGAMPSPLATVGSDSKISCWGGGQFCFRVLLLKSSEKGGEYHLCYPCLLL